MHAVRVCRGEHAGHEPTGHRGHEGCLLAPDVVEHGPQVVHPLFERRKRRRRHGIRQADAALVETDHTRECGQTIVEPRERSDLALDLDVAEPLLGHYDVYPTRAEGSIGDMEFTALCVPGGARHLLQCGRTTFPRQARLVVQDGSSDDGRPRRAHLSRRAAAPDRRHGVATAGRPAVPRACRECCSSRSPPVTPPEVEEQPSRRSSASRLYRTSMG